MMRIVDLDGDGKMKFSEFSDLMKVLLPDIKEKPQKEEVTRLMVMKMVLTIVKALKISVLISKIMKMVKVRKSLPTSFAVFKILLKQPLVAFLAPLSFKHFFK